jgi:NADP-dependent 3-hydroxy acid dehydrogenase YdfG
VGLTIAVTGAARGIGAATARELARRGHSLLLGDLDADAVSAVASELGAVAGPLDVTSDASYAAWLALVPAVDVLVSNAGVMWVGAWDEEPEEVARRQLEVNFLGVVRGTRLVVPQMRSRGRGHLVTVASAASYVAPPGEATYAATKHAVHGWSKAVRRELRGTGVELSLVMPTVVTTELAAGTASGGVPPLAPEDVARAVADVVERPRFEVFVPRRIAALTRVLALLPQPGRDAMQRALVPDQVKQTDHAARAAYEEKRLGR